MTSYLEADQVGAYQVGRYTLDVHIGPENKTKLARSSLARGLLEVYKKSTDCTSCISLISL
jgi:hypothetical protein